MMMKFMHENGVKFSSRFEIEKVEKYIEKFEDRIKSLSN